MHPVKTKQGREIASAFTSCFERLTKHGHEVSLHVLDNECSEDTKATFKKASILFELVPPHIHRRNAAERAIRTMKNHLLAGLASCDPDFPITEWDRLLHQCELTLNLLRTSRVNPKLSAWAYLNGIHDFNKSPLAPPGTKVVFHKKASNRESWAFHGLEGWYVGPAPEHYRCLRIFVPDKHSEVNSDTVKFIPRYIPIPECSIDDHLKKTVNDLVHLLLNKSPAVPVLQPESARAALIKIAELLNRDSSPNIKEIPQPAGKTHAPTHIPTTTSPHKITPKLLPLPHTPSTTNALPSHNTSKLPKKVSWKTPLRSTINHEETTHSEKITKVIQDVIKNTLQQQPVVTSKGVMSKSKPRRNTSKGEQLKQLNKRTTTAKTTLTPARLSHRVDCKIPTSKMVTNSTPPQQTSISKQGRKRVQRYDYAAPTKAYAAQYLAATEQLNKILHMFNEEGKKKP